MKKAADPIVIAYADLTDGEVRFGSCKGRIVRGKPVPNDGSILEPHHFHKSPLQVQQSGKIFVSWAHEGHEGTVHVFVRTAVGHHARRFLLNAMKAMTQEFSDCGFGPSTDFKAKTHPTAIDTEPRKGFVFLEAHLCTQSHWTRAIVGARVMKDTNGVRRLVYSSGHEFEQDLTPKMGHIHEIPSQRQGWGVWCRAKDALVYQDKLRELLQAAVRKQLNDALTLRDRLLRLNVTVPLFEECQ